MTTNVSKLGRISKLVTDELDSKPRIVIDPSKFSNIVSDDNSRGIDINICFDADPWTITDEMREYITKLNEDSSLSNEEKIIKIYTKLCNDYVYDDNGLSYLSKEEDDTFSMPDDYGRNTGEEWKKNRATHNRRTCFEISRILAKSISTMLSNTTIPHSYETCILWDEANTHYFVGLVNNEYCATLDLDDYNKLKDLTRFKTDLTLKGITFLDPKGQVLSPELESEQRMKKAIEEVNVQNRYENPEDCIEDKRNNNEEKNSSNKSVLPSEIQYLKDAIEILINDYGIDSAGLFDYMKELVDRTLGPASRRKVWKKVDESRYTRCLVVKLGNSDKDEEKLYVIDVTQNDINEIFHTIEKNDISKNPQSGQDFITNLHRDFNGDPSYGR